MHQDVNSNSTDLQFIDQHVVAKVILARMYIPTEKNFKTESICGTTHDLRHDAYLF